jgi:hypothetical protein
VISDQGRCPLLPEEECLCPVEREDRAKAKCFVWQCTRQRHHLQPPPLGPPVAGSGVLPAPDPLRAGADEVHVHVDIALMLTNANNNNNNALRTAYCVLRIYVICSGYVHFLNAPHIKNRPLKTILSYAK